MRTVANMRTPDGGFLVEMTSVEHAALLHLAKIVNPDCILTGKRVPLCERESADDVDQPDLMDGEMPKLVEVLLYVGDGIGSIDKAILLLQDVQSAIIPTSLRASARS